MNEESNKTIWRNNTPMWVGCLAIFLMASGAVAFFIFLFETLIPALIVFALGTLPRWWAAYEALPSWGQWLVGLVGVMFVGTAILIMPPSEDSDESGDQ